MNKTKVTVFGNEMDEGKMDKNWRCHNHPGSIFWGVFILFLGLTFLLNNLGIIPWSTWNGVWHFWPVIIIVIGVQILLGHSLISRFITFLITLFIFATLFGVVILKTTPSSLTFVPIGVTNYLQTVSNYLNTK